MATTNGSTGISAKEYYDDDKHLMKLCDFLRSSEGPPVREAIQEDKRVYYIKGEKLVNFMFEPKKGTKWPKDLPKFQTRPEAIAVCKELCVRQYMHRSDKVGKGELEVSRTRDFDEGAYFTWIYEGNKKFSNFLTTCLIIGFLCCTCFPIWPNFLKVFVWYMSVSMLIFVFILITFRAVVFLSVWVMGYELWILPNLFDESLGFCESFLPVYSCDKTKDGQLMYRIGVFVAFFSFCYWAVTQPSEFDGFLKGQGDFIKDLYEGTLLSDMSQKDKENIDKPKMPSLEDLLKKLDSEDEEEIALSEEEAAEALLDSLVDDEDEDIVDEED